MPWGHKAGRRQRKLSPLWREYHLWLTWLTLFSGYAIMIWIKISPFCGKVSHADIQVKCNMSFQFWEGSVKSSAGLVCWPCQWRLVSVFISEILYWDWCKNQCTNKTVYNLWLKVDQSLIFFHVWLGKAENPDIWGTGGRCLTFLLEKSNYLHIIFLSVA